LDAEVASDYRIVKHFETSLQRLNSPAFERESHQGAKEPCNILPTSGSQTKPAAATAFYSASRSNPAFAQIPAFSEPTSAVHWWPLRAFFIAALAGIVAAYFTDAVRILFRGSA
jgi:hypothetical protein